MMLTGRRVSAEEALRIGLVADVVAGPALPERALDAALRSPRWPPGACV